MAVKLNEMEKKQTAVDIHPIKIWHVTTLIGLWENNQITYSRMVEILNEIAAGRHKNGIEL